MKRDHSAFTSQAVALALAFSIIPYKVTYAQKKRSRRNSVVVFCWQIIGP